MNYQFFDTLFVNHLFDRRITSFKFILLRIFFDIVRDHPPIGFSGRNVRQIDLA